MLSSLPGTAVTTIKIDGVQHEFSTIPGAYQRQYARKDGDYLILIMLFTPDEETIPFSTLEGYLSSLSES